MAAPGITTWRHLPTWRQRATRRRQTRRRRVASGAMDPRGVAGRSVRALPARAFRICLQSSGDICTPTGYAL